MQVSGQPHEGWMTLLPLTVFIFVIVWVVGGPTAFANTLSVWVTDALMYIAGWLKYL